MNAMGKMRATTAVQRAFDGRRRLRNWRNTHFGGMRAVKAHPLSMCRFRPDEGGTVSTNLNIKLAPVSGYMRSKAYVDVVQVYVPYQAIEKIRTPDQEDSGVTEMTKRRMMSGDATGLGHQNEISAACNIHPISIAGTKRVQGSIRFAYSAAINHLRKHAYYDAKLLDNTNTTIAPAILTANVLERFDGVLDPEKHIDGAINLTGELPVRGVITENASFPYGPTTGRNSAGETEVLEHTKHIGNQTPAGNLYLEENPDKPGYPNIRADLSGVGELTLRDMIESQKLDGLIRQFAKIIEDDPINGEEAVQRALYGLTVDFDANCHVLYRKVHTLTAKHQRPTDGASINDVSAHFELNTNFATIVPRSQLGGQLVTIAMIKPLETLSKQPDPAQTEKWELVNRIHDETQLDEDLLRRAQLESDLNAADEDTPAFWVGHNSLKHDYTTQGPNDQQTAGVQLKSSMWTYEVPTSVTPSNVSYPAAGISMYPFYNWNGPHAEYTIDQVAVISTSLARGPNPIEKIKLFADDPTLVDPDA